MTFCIKSQYQTMFAPNIYSIIYSFRGPLWNEIVCNRNIFLVPSHSIFKTFHCFTWLRCKL